MIINKTSITINNTQAQIIGHKQKAIDISVGYMVSTMPHETLLAQLTPFFIIIAVKIPPITYKVEHIMNSSSSLTNPKTDI